MRRQGTLYNGEGEVIAQGLCEVNEEHWQVSMWPTLEKGLFERERGLMTLTLEGGTALRISERRLKLKISPPQGPHTSIYRMHVERLPAALVEQRVSQGTEGIPASVQRADLPGGLSTAP